MPSATLKKQAPAPCAAAPLKGCNCAVPVCALRLIQGSNRAKLTRKEDECCDRATD